MGDRATLNVDGKAGLNPSGKVAISPHKGLCKKCGGDCNFAVCACSVAGICKTAKYVNVEISGWQPHLNSNGQGIGQYVCGFDALVMFWASGSLNGNYKFQQSTELPLLGGVADTFPLGSNLSWSYRVKNPDFITLKIGQYSNPVDVDYWLNMNVWEGGSFACWVETVEACDPQDPYVCLADSGAPYPANYGDPASTYIGVCLNTETLTQTTATGRVANEQFIMGLDGTTITAKPIYQDDSGTGTGTGSDTGTGEGTGTGSQDSKDPRKVCNECKTCPTQLGINVDSYDGTTRLYDITQNCAPHKQLVIDSDGPLGGTYDLYGPTLYETELSAGGTYSTNFGVSPAATIQCEQIGGNVYWRLDATAQTTVSVGSGTAQHNETVSCSLTAYTPADFSSGIWDCIPAGSSQWNVTSYNVSSDCGSSQPQIGSITDIDDDESDSLMIHRVPPAPAKSTPLKKPCGCGEKKVRKSR